MRITFRVGPPSAIFGTREAARVKALLQFQFGEAIIRPDVGFYESRSVSLEGWCDLQDLGAEQLGEEEVENVLAVQATRGVWVPAPTPVGEMPIDATTPLEIGCLETLINELHLLAVAAGYPTPEADVARLDGEPHVIAYREVLLAAFHASRRQSCLWLVA